MQRLKEKKKKENFILSIQHPFKVGIFNLQFLADKLKKQGGELCLSHAFQYITKSQSPGDERHFQYCALIFILHF